MSRLTEFLTGAQGVVEGCTSNRPTPERLALLDASAAQLREDGIPVRLLCPSSVRGDAQALDSVLALGAETRTLPVLPVRMVMVDRRQALVANNPDEPPDEGMLLTTGGGMLAALSSLFDQLWAQGQELGGSWHGGEQDGVLSLSERELLRLLAAGNTDEGVARQLQVSPRTVRRMLADLCEQVGARNRFELAARSVSRGWLTLR